MATVAEACLPHPTPTLPYWLGESYGSIAKYRSNKILPTNVDTVIIGSGIIGALTAFNLLSRNNDISNKPVLMLDARSIASGATGRNGGHIKPDVYKSFANQETLFGIDEARRHNAFEMDNLEKLTQFIKDNGFATEVDLVETRAVDVFLDHATWMEARSSYDRLRASGCRVNHIQIFNAEETESKFRFCGAQGAISFPACSLWPHKLAAAIIKRCIDRGMQLFTHTTVTHVVSTSKNPGRWTVCTNDGKVECSRVVHATNGYASSLIPELRGRLIPVKGHVVALNPTNTYVSKPLTQTFGVYWNDDYDYLIQRPTDGRPLIYGGGERGDPGLISQALDNCDDSSINPSIINNLVSMPKEHLISWLDAKDNEETVRYAWSGILGFTSDGYPYVGEIPGKPGQFVIAGFNGHGMARGFLTVQTLCQLIHREPVDPFLPKIYLDTVTRLQKVDLGWNEVLRHARSNRKQPEFENSEFADTGTVKLPHNS